MTKKPNSLSEQALADRLRREAIDSRPAFSEELHTRICRAVEEARGRPLPRELPSGRASARWLLAIAMAASVLLILAALWQMQVLKSPQEQRVPEIARQASAGSPGTTVVSTPTSATSNPVTASAPEKEFEAMADLAALVTDGVVQSSLIDRRWGYLDDDFRLAVEFIAERFPWSDTATATSKN